MVIQQQLKKRDMSQHEFVWPLKTYREVNGFFILDVPFICALIRIIFLNIKKLMKGM